MYICMSAYRYIEKDGIRKMHAPPGCRLGTTPAGGRELRQSSIQGLSRYLAFVDSQVRVWGTWPESSSKFPVTDREPTMGIYICPL